MRNKVQYVCGKCGHIHLEKKTLLKKLILVPKYAFLVVVTMMLLMGLLATYNLMISLNYPQESELSGVGGLHSLINKYKSNFVAESDYQKLRNIAFNLSSGCDSDICRVKKIYDELEPNSIFDDGKAFTYEEGTNLNPLEIWEEKSGDCDEMSYLMFSLLKSIGIKSNLQCSNNHCWLIVKTEGKEIIADLTKHEYKVIK